MTTLVFLSAMGTKNNFFIGLLLGSVLPVISWFLFAGLFGDVIIMRKHGVPYLVVIAINLLLLRYFYSKGQEKTSMGMMLVTFVFMLLVFILKFKQ